MQPIRTNLSALNKKQAEAVVSDDKRLLVLAGTGSGKTKTLLQKIVYLMDGRRGAGEHPGDHIREERCQ